MNTRHKIKNKTPIRFIAIDVPLLYLYYTIVNGHILVKSSPHSLVTSNKYDSALLCYIFYDFYACMNSK